MSLNVEVLERSFAQIKPRSTEFAASFYNNLFIDYPQAQPLFANTNMAEQQQHLMSSLVLVIDSLRKPEVLTDALKKLGARHVNYGTIGEHYPIVGATLLKTFESYLGADWTPEVKQAWTDAYEAIASIMLEGAKHVA
jgi:hemoglobin-like flavoprotein